VSGRSNGGISAKAARLNARLRSRISEFVLSSVFGLICVPPMKRWVLVLFDTNMATIRSYQLPSQPCGLPSDCVGCTFYRGTEHQYPQGGRSRDGQTSVSLHTMPGWWTSVPRPSLLKFFTHCILIVFTFFSLPCDCCRKISCLVMQCWVTARPNCTILKWNKRHTSSKYICLILY